MFISFRKWCVFITYSLLNITMAFASDPARSIIIDTDLGLDDVVAITYLLQQSSINIKAISIAATGETACELGYVNLKRMLHQLGKTHIPLFCGRGTPLHGTHRFPSEWSPFQAKIKASTQLIKKNAVKSLTQILQNSKEAYDIIALGPLTNIGEMLQKTPSLAKKIHMLYIMGGALDVPGNLQLGDKRLNDKAEWNIYIDPQAAQLVFQSSVPITLIPLDITNQIKLPPDFYAKLKHSPSKAAAYIHQMVQSLTPEASSALDEANWYAWDTLAAVIAIHPQFAKTNVQKVRVILDPEYNSGTMIKDMKSKKVNVCYEIDKKKFMTSLYQSLTQISG